MRHRTAIAVGILGGLLILGPGAPRVALNEAFAQDRPAPVVDMHLHAAPADDQGPPPLGICMPLTDLVRDARDDWRLVFLSLVKKPACPAPIWSPATDEALMNETLAVLRRRNIVGMISGPLDFVRRWRAVEADRLIPGLSFAVGPDSPTPDALLRLKKQGQLAVLGEVTNQYMGIPPGDPSFEPYLAMAEANDIPVAIHIGTGPPGAPYLGFQKYRASLHSALTLEEPLLRHPRLRVYIMHAGWPMIDDLLAVLWAHPQVHVDVGAIVWALPQAELYRYLQRIVEAGFGRRVMFGSDQMVWPGVIEPSIERIESAPFLSAAQKRDILYNNAARFLRFTDAEIARHHGR